MKTHRALLICSFALILAPLAAQEPPVQKSLSASVISLKGKLSLEDALKKLEQTGNKVVDLRARLGQEVPNPTLVLDLDQVPFWQAADAVARQANLKLSPYIDPETREAVLGVQALEAGPAGKLMHIRYSGPFRIVVKQLTAVRNLENEALSGLTATLEIAWEPRYQPLMLRLAHNSVQATSATGQLRPVDQGGTGAIKLAGEASIELPLRLPVLPRSAATLKELHGEFAAWVPPEMTTFEFKKLAAGDQDKKGDVVVTLSRFQADRNARLWSFGITLEYPRRALELESHQTWAMEANEAILQHRVNKTQVRTRLNPEIAIDEGRSIRISYYFADVPGKPDDYELLYRAQAAAPVRYPIRFAFSDLPLP